MLTQGSHYFQIRGRSDFSFRELTGRSGRQQTKLRRFLGETNVYSKFCFAAMQKSPCPSLVNSLKEAPIA